MSDASLTVGELRRRLDGLPEDMPCIVRYDSYLGEGPLILAEPIEAHTDGWGHVHERVFAVGTP